jgi:hypothetical protein
MDPTNNQGPDEDYGQDGRTGEGAAPKRPPRDPLTPDFGQHAPALARTVQLVSGDFLLTVNPVDGSEIEPCPPGERPPRPVKFTAAERAEVRRASLPPEPPGPALPRLPLLERQEERERLTGLLERGRSVRLTGPAGSGRTAMLEAVAEDCADLAPDGVVRLSGYGRTAGDLLHDLFAAVPSRPNSSNMSGRSARSSSWTTWNSAAARSTSCSTRPPSAPSSSRPHPMSPHPRRTRISKRCSSAD